MRKKSAFIGFEASKDNPKILKIYDGVHSAEGPTQDKELTTTVYPGAYIVFVPFGDITKIVDIAYEKGPDLFEKMPRQKNSGIWQGKVTKKISKNPESYQIHYKVDGHEEIFKQDPRIIVDQ